MASIHRATDWEKYDRARSRLWPSKKEVEEKLAKEDRERQERVRERISKRKAAKKARLAKSSLGRLSNIMQQGRI